MWTNIKYMSKVNQHTPRTVLIIQYIEANQHIVKVNPQMLRLINIFTFIYQSVSVTVSESGKTLLRGKRWGWFKRKQIKLVIDIFLQSTSRSKVLNYFQEIAVCITRSPGRFTPFAKSYRYFTEEPKIESNMDQVWMSDCDKKKLQKKGIKKYIRTS